MLTLRQQIFFFFKLNITHKDNIGGEGRDFIFLDNQIEQSFSIPILSKRVFSLHFKWHLQGWDKFKANCSG